jgi:predicted DNA-binding transcriptional regulator AlpA
VTASTPAPVVVIGAAELAGLVREAVREELEGRTTPESDEPMLLSCSKLCKKLGVSRASVYRWRAAGLKSIRAGDEHRYILAEVLEWLRGRA